VLLRSALALIVAAGAGFVVAVTVMAGAVIGPAPPSEGDSRAGCSGVCGELVGAVPAGPADRFGLPASYTIPGEANPAEVAVVEYALAQLGKAYVWGAAGPDAFDCSGLTMMAWATAGVPLAHYTVDQLGEGNPVTDVALVSPGDLVLVPGSDGTMAAPGHVGLYIGQGLVESAVDPAEGVIVQSWAAFTAGGLSGVRHIG
jgi:peptidoglycan DL-endopeptidase CwlO